MVEIFKWINPTNIVFKKEFKNHIMINIVVANENHEYLSNQLNYFQKRALVTPSWILSLVKNK